MKNIGLQLYSVRHEAEKDFIGTIKKVAETGFTEVEFAGYYGYSAKDMKEILDGFGLKAVSSHCDALGNIYGEIDYLNKVGAANIVVPHNPFENREAVLRLAEEMNKAGKIYKENGLTLGYHNHSHEFAADESGETLYDIFFQNTDPQYVSMQMDVCWVKVAGYSPLEYLKKYEGRSSTIHFKEVKTISPYEGAAIGRGIIDFKGIYDYLGPDIKYIVEQEDIPGDMWEALEESTRYLKNI